MSLDYSAGDMASLNASEEVENIAELSEFIAEAFADDVSEDEYPMRARQVESPASSFVEPPMPAPWAQEFRRTFSRVRSFPST